MSATSTSIRSSNLTNTHTLSTSVTSPRIVLRGLPGDELDSTPIPTKSELFEELYGIYKDPDAVAKLMCLFTEVAETFEAVRAGDLDAIRAARSLKEERGLTGRGYHAFVDIPRSEEALHILLERIMLDLEEPRFGTTHDRANCCFLPPGYVFVHDYAEGCIVAVA